MGKKLDLANQKVNMLTAIENIGSDKNHKSLWLCKCECGNTLTIRGSDFKKGHYISCGCSRKINEIGNTYGKLTVIKEDTSKNKKNPYWYCKCSCGNPVFISVKGSYLRDGSVSSCGRCNDVIDETGKKYSKLLVLERDWENKNSGAYWKCKCDCGNIVSVLGTNLRKNITTSCGCIHSKGELKIQKILREMNIPFIQQYSFKDLKDKGLLKFDFAIIKDKEVVLLIEYQGEQHYFEKRSFKNKKFEDGLKRDELKRNYCLNNNYNLIEIPYTDYDKINKEYLNLILKKYEVL